MNRENLRLRRWAWICLAPGLAWMLLWLGIPLLRALALALQDPSSLPAGLADPRLHRALSFTALFSALSVSLELALGLALALALARPLPGSALWRGALLIPWAVPTAVSAKAFAWLFNYQFGLVNLCLVKLGGPQAAVNWFASAPAAVAALLALELWKTLPLVALLLLAGRLQLPAAPYEAAALDGAGPLACFRHLTLPLLGPMILVAGLLRLVDALRIFDSIWVLSGGGPAGATESLSFLAYVQSFQLGDKAAGARSGLLNAALVLAAAWMLHRLRPASSREEA